MRSQAPAISFFASLYATLAFAKGAAIIAGYVYHDTNHDGQRKEEEKPFDKITVHMKQLTERKNETKAFEIQTDSYGYFHFRIPVDNISSYMIKIILPKGYKTVDSNPIILSDLKPNTQKIVEFGLVPSGEAVPSPSKKPLPTSQPTKTPQISPIQ